MHMMSILCSVADALSPGNLFTLSKVLKLNVTLWTVFLHLSNFDLGLSSVADLSNPEVWAPTAAEHAFCLSARSTMRLGHMLWIRVIVTFVGCFFNFFVLLNNWCHPYEWVAVVSWLNSLILAVDPTMDSSALLHTHHASSYGFWWYKKMGFTLDLLSFNLVKLQLYTFSLKKKIFVLF